MVENELSEMAQNYLLDKYNNEDEDRWTPTEGEYHATDCSKCPRKVFFKHLGGTTDNDLFSCRNFERGRIIEYYAENVLKEEYGYRYIGNSIETEIKFNDGVKIVGETDPVIFGENGKITELYEVKSKDHTNFEYVEDEPQENHVRQCHVYMRGLGLDECKLWYIKLPGFDDVLHTVEFSDVLWGEIVGFLGDVHKSIENGEVPEDGPLYDWECSYCPYQDKCDKERD